MKIAEIDQEALDQWIATRPPVIQEMIRSHPPDRLYRIKGASRCTLHSYEEDRTCTVNVTGEYNFLAFERRVFGVPIDDLTECDGPSDGELIGAVAQ